MFRKVRNDLKRVTGQIVVEIEDENLDNKLRKAMVFVKQYFVLLLNAQVSEN